jgi:hypothetical protein
VPHKVILPNITLNLIRITLLKNLNLRGGVIKKNRNRNNRSQKMINYLVSVNIQ